MSVHPLPAPTSTASRRSAFGPQDPGREERNPDEALLLRALLERRCGAEIATEAAPVLLAAFGSVGAVLAAEAGTLSRLASLPAAAVADLHLLRALAVRLTRIDAQRRPLLTNWSAVEAYARAAIAHEVREQFRVLFLDCRNRLMGDEHQAEGTATHAPVYPRELIRRALELGASAMILIHNHPSGDPTPSTADVDMTRKIVAAAEVFDLKVHDHLVIGRHGSASLRGLGLM